MDATIDKSRRPGRSYRRGKITLSRTVIMAEVCRHKWPSPPWAETLYSLWAPNAPVPWAQAPGKESFAVGNAFACLHVDPEWL